jgi:hypothetical protein
VVVIAVAVLLEKDKRCNEECMCHKKTKILAHISTYLPPSLVAPNKNLRKHEDSQPESIVQQIIISSPHNCTLHWLPSNFWNHIFRFKKIDFKTEIKIYFLEGS